MTATIEHLESTLPPLDLRWGCDRAFIRPSEPLSGRQRSIVDSGYLRPFFSGRGLSVVNKEPIVAKIPALFGVGCPSAILGAIVAVVVWVSVKGMLVAWALAHVGKEVLKRLTPAVANSYAFRAVLRVALVGFYVASADHVPPRLILWPACPSMFEIVGSQSLAVVAAAARYFALSKTSPGYYGTFSALANAVPSSLSRLGRCCLRDDAQSSELVVRLNIFGGANNLSARHDCASMKGTVVDRAARRANVVSGSLHFMGVL